MKDQVNKKEWKVKNEIGKRCWELSEEAWRRKWEQGRENGEVLWRPECSMNRAPAMMMNKNWIYLVNFGWTLYILTFQEPENVSSSGHC